MSGPIHASDVVVCRVNGTIDLYVVASVDSVEDGLRLSGIEVSEGQSRSIQRGCDRQRNDQQVWLFDGSATGYVEATRVRDILASLATRHSVVKDEAQQRPVDPELAVVLDQPEPPKLVHEVVDA